MLQGTAKEEGEHTTMYVSDIYIHYILHVFFVHEYMCVIDCMIDCIDCIMYVCMYALRYRPEWLGRLISIDSLH